MNVIGWKRIARRVAVLGLAFFAGCGGASDSDGPQAVGSASSAQATRGGNPPGVPEEFVVTPNGYFHPSCIIELGNDERVRDDGKIERANGETRDVPRCDHPHYDKLGRAIAADAPEPTISGWVESGSNSTLGPLNWISANWTVPAAPQVPGAQTLYYFPGLEPLDASSNTAAIMQPVLEWNSGAWTIASWNCCVTGSVFHGPTGVVHSGDTLYGYVQGNNCNSSGVCSQWQVYTGDWTNGVSSSLNTTSYGNVMNWAFGGALEAYGVDTCTEYPSTGGSVTFSNIQVRATSYLEVYPAWSPWVVSGVTPVCGYGVTSPNTSTVTVSVTP
jgi:hypothetical protein